MNSELLNQIGLSGMDPGIVIIILLVICIISIVIAFISMSKTKQLQSRIDAFMKGKNARSLEETITKIENDHSEIKAYIEQNKKDIRKIYRNLEISYQKASLLRYDAFKESGGQLSFTMCILNDRNNGFIINSIHGNNGCYIYGKEIENGLCKINLSEEEQQVLDKALLGGNN